MNLQEFVIDVLVSLDKAITETRVVTQREVRFSEGKNQRTVEFDIAVSAEEVESSSGKAGIRVLQFAEAGGELSTGSKNSTVSRVQFGIHIDSMTKDEDARSRAETEIHNNNQMNNSFV